MEMTTSTIHALIDQLQRIMYAEKKVRDEFNLCKQAVSSQELKAELDKYAGNVTDKILKLQRGFNYLMQEPQKHKAEVINKLIEETHQMLDYETDVYLKDLLIVTCFENINAYKTASYRTAYLFAAELGLDTVADLLQQILEWEIDTGKSLTSLSIHKINKAIN